MRCPECGSSKIEWGITHRGHAGISDGRHNIGEIQTIAWIGCVWCSETIWQLDQDQLIELLTVTGAAHTVGLWREQELAERARRRREYKEANGSGDA